MSQQTSQKTRILAGHLLSSIWSLGRALAAVVCSIAFFAIVDIAVNGRDATFWSTSNLQTISVQNAFVAIAALGMLLVIIAGGIDLSAGMALALSAAITAWGLREDVGFLIAHGQNVAGAAQQLKTADAAVQAAERRNDDHQLDQLREVVSARRRQLIDLVQIKLDQLESSAGEGTPSLRLQSQITELRRGLQNMRDASTPTETDPTWIRIVPNASSSGCLAVLMGIGTGILCGLFNGLIIVLLRVVPFIATLATMTIYLGLAKIVADETAVRPLPHQVPDWLSELSAVRPSPSWLLVSKGVWLALLLAAVVACILRYTVFGRYLFAIGSNELTARLCGVNVPMIKVAVYTLSGLLLGVAAICFFSRLNSGNPTSGTGLELKFIAAVVIGGGSLSGGRGTVLGAVAGTAIMGIIASGCTLLGMRNPLQDIVLGLIILAAVTVDQWRK